MDLPNPKLQKLSGYLIEPPKLPNLPEPYSPKALNTPQTLCIRMPSVRGFRAWGHKGLAFRVQGSRVSGLRRRV